MGIPCNGMRNGDPSERKRAGKTFRESEKMYRTLVETSPDGITLTSLDGTLLMANREAARLYGCETPEELLALGKNAFDLIAPEDRERAAANARKTLEQGSVRNLRYSILRKDGSTYPAEISASVVPDAEGRPKWFLGVVRDISEREHAEEEILRKTTDLQKAVKRLEEIEAWMSESEKIRTLGTLAAGVAHEFNNILTGIMGCASYLLMHTAEESDMREYVRMILQSSKQASNLTRQLLGVVRKGQPEARVFSVNNTVAELAMILSRTFPRRITVETECDPEIPTVRGKPAQVHQALLNLCVNARDAMPAGGSLLLMTERIAVGDPSLPPSLEPGEYIALSVVDSGPGVPEGLRERIFEPFFSTKADGAGTGLGLSLVGGIAKDHHGAVTVGGHDGPGATFTLFLPADAGEEPTTPTEKRVQKMGTGRVLVIDDGKINRLVIERVLTGAGYAVLSASSGEEALEILRGTGEPVDLVILDIMMPGIGGERTFPIVREQFPDCKVIILTGLAADDVPASLRDPDLAFIQKPLEARDILDVVSNVLKGEPHGEP